MESRRRYTLRQFHPSPVNRNWRVKENYHLCANDLQKIDFCSQAAPGTKSKDEDHKTKVIEIQEKTGAVEVNSVLNKTKSIIYMNLVIII